jgi:hypothetical protein
MKKIMFFISLLFAVVCYAAPPPDLLPDPVTDQCGYVVQDNQNVTVYTFEVQEVAFVDIGNSWVYSNVSALKNDFQMLPEIEFTEGVIMYGNSLIVNNGYCPNKQHSNYGYPFGADYRS